MKNLYVVILLSSFFLISCRSTIEEIKNINTEPKLNPVDPPVRWSEDVSQNGVNYSTNKNSLWQVGSRSFFKGHKAMTIGDILQVKVNINDSANLKNKTTTKRNNKEDMGLTGLFGVQSQLEKFIEMPSGAPLVGTTSANQLEGDGSINRTEVIKTTVAAMIKEIMPNGNLLIEGSQQVKVNLEVRELYVSGIVRPKDIASDNSISLEQVAEARVAMGGKGSLSRVQKPRYGAQLMDILLPW